MLGVLVIYGRIRTDNLLQSVQKRLHYTYFATVLSNLFSIANTPCPKKIEATLFSTITLVSLGAFL